MNAERLKQIDDDAISKKLPDAFTVQALCAEIRIAWRTIEEQRQIIMSLRKPLTPVQGSSILASIITRTP
jgi:hypothetical protein